MELGGFFDDGLFEEARDRNTRPSLTNYSAKICESEWFNEETTSEDPLVRMQLHKHSSDWAYRCRDYNKALFHYQAAIDLLPVSNHTMLRDMLESVTRCYLGLNQPEDALVNLLRLEAWSQTYDQRTGYLRVATLVYRALGRQIDELLALQQTLWLHPMLCDVWVSLARVYLEQLNLPTPSSTVDMPTIPADMYSDHQSDVTSEASTVTAHMQCLNLNPCDPVIDRERAAFTCLLRARALAGCVRKQPEFVTHRYQNIYKTINLQIKELKLEDSLINACLPHVTIDLQGDADMSRPTEGRSEADLAKEIHVDGFQAMFERHWFNWR